MTKKQTKTKTKTKIKIQGKNYMIPVEVKNSIEFLSEIIRAHEVALLTWVHKIHNKQAFDNDDIESFEENMYEYAMRIPNAEDIIKNMVNIDKRAKEPIQETVEENETTEKS